jgi:NAD(P)-dependent dehydrogenase (short-subunit alcohol dehydrogenase family)
MKEVGSIFGLVNNAGIGKATPFLEMTEDDWDRVQNVNIRGVFLMCREVAPALVDQGAGSIVNISSIAGKDGFPNWSHYAASKHAVIGLTRSMARELGPSGVRVNAVCPGAIKTDIWSAEAQGTDDPDGLFDAFVEKTALRRGQTSEDVAAMVAFLLGNQAENITAQSISVDSGLLVN